MKKKTCLLIGASGLIGRQLLNLLLDDAYYSKVTILVRKSLNINDTKLDEKVINFDNLKNEIPKVDHIFCTLGTTIKVAGSQEKFREVDFDYPLIAAEVGREKGATSYSIVTAIGANYKSNIFYSRVKGEIEEAIKKLGFDSIQIFRPSLLVGQRSESRTGESFGIGLFSIISPIMIGPLKRYAPIKGEIVAKAMLKQAKKELTGDFIFNSDKILDSV